MPTYVYSKPVRAARRLSGVLLTTVALTTSAIAFGSTPASAASVYSCPLADLGSPCSGPLSGVTKGDVREADGGFFFGGGNGYVRVDNSAQIDTSTFPISMSVQVKGVGVPSQAVGDYDLIRGTTGGAWRVEVVPRKKKTIAQAACFFAGPNARKLLAGGPDLKGLQNAWTTITCTNTGTSIRLYVNGNLEQSVALSTGKLSNPGGLLIGAKDTSGGDQFTGYARAVEISVP
jgi:hypothetical protein